MEKSQDGSGKPIILSFPIDLIVYVYYHSYNNFLIIISHYIYGRNLKILSMEITTIKAGQTNKYREIYAEKYAIWDIDIPNYPKIISNKKNQP